VWLVAAALVAVQTIVRGWIAYRGSFYLDDLAFTGRAATMPLVSAKYLFTAYNNHFMPGSFAWVWVLTRLAPLSYPVVATVDIALQIVLDVVIYRLFRALFGPRRALLIPYALVLFTPLTLPAFLWWAAALNQLPQQLAIATALLCQVRYLRTGKVRTGIYGAVALAGGLLFSEKTLLLAPLVIAFTALFFGAPPADVKHGVRARLRAALVPHWRVWAAYLVIAIPYAVYYVLAIPSPVHQHMTGADVFALAGSAFGHAIAPGLVGGPWRWQPIGWAGAVAAPGPAGTVIAVVIVAAAAVASVLLFRRAWLGWLIAAGYAVLVVALLAFSRATVVGAAIGNEMRYVTDVALVGVLGATLAFLPLAPGAWLAAEPRQLQVRPAVRQRLTDDARLLLRSLSAPVIGGVVVAALVISCLVSTFRYAPTWTANPTKPYLANARADLTAAPSVIIANQPVPAQIAWPPLFPYNTAANVLAPLITTQHFLQVGESTDQLYAVDGDGHLRIAAIDAVATARPGPVAGCGWLVRDAPVTVRLTRRVLPWTWTVRIGYIANVASSTTIRAGLQTFAVAVHPGVNAIYLQVTGAVDHLDFGALPAGASLCTNDVEVGTPAPVPGTGPA
jgi:hypothetical protein